MITNKTVRSLQGTGALGQTDNMIVLFTDFGLHGPYTGQIKAVLHQIAPGIPVVDLFADAPVGNPKASAYLLAVYAGWFPAETVFLCVVDPGVGGARPSIILEADGRWYVGPGNGLFELIQRRAGETRSWDIDWEPERLSASFQGRDLFAPVAGMLARGAPPPGRPREVGADRRADWPDDLGEIVYVDHFGNAMTGLRAAMLAPNGRLAAADRVLGRARGRVLPLRLRRNAAWSSWTVPRPRNRSMSHVLRDLAFDDWATPSGKGPDFR
jgi:S-adenosyl-L-methionine hydrolase (adenosine-forming)